MGNQSSIEEHDEFKNITKKYTFEKKYTDSRFGEIKLLREKSTGIQVFQKDISCNTKLEYELISKEIKERSSFSHPNLLRVLGFVAKKEDMFCADFFKLSLFYESFEEDLEQAIFKRQKAKEPFQEVELWYIFDSIVSVLAFFQENKLYHGDIRPFNLFINAAQEYKISDPALFRGNFQPGYFSLLENLEDKSHYPSPELFKALKGEHTPNQFDKTKNDVFALGMSLLEAANLQKPEGVYNWDDFTVNHDEIDKLLKNMKDKYSETFIQTIRFTLNQNEADRPDFLTLDRELAPYRVDIRARISHQQPPPMIMAERLSVPVEDELEKRVRAALRKSEETISRSSPSKYQNKHLDPYIHSYINNQPIPQDKPLLQTISAYLSPDNKYTMTLTQYPVEDRGSEQLRRSQFAQPEERKEGFLDANQSGYNYQPEGYQQPPAFIPENHPMATSGLQNQNQNQYVKSQGQSQNNLGQSQNNLDQNKPLATSQLQNQNQNQNPLATSGLSQNQNQNQYVKSQSQSQNQFDQSKPLATSGVQAKVEANPYQFNYDTSYQANTNYQANPYAGGSVDTADVLRQVEETLKKSQNFQQN